MKKNFIILFVFFASTSCIVDLEPERVTIDAKDIETLVLNVDRTKYLKLDKSDDFPVIAWYGIPAGRISIERFKEVKEAGINYHYQNYPNADTVKKVLDIAQQIGMKIIIACPEIRNTPVEIARRFKGHPANAGYFIFDEPAANMFPYINGLVKKIMTTDPDRFCYVNLFPNHTPLDGLISENYTDYVTRAINEIPLKILSFDNYPIVEKNVRWDWYANLETIRQLTENAGIPFWAFALTTAHDYYPIPDINQLRLQVYSNLAYGAKGIQYFTYWNPSSTKWNFNNAPILQDGTRTNVYDVMKHLNQEIRSLAHVFQDSEVVKVEHYGKDIPYGTKSLDRLPTSVNFLNIRGGNALISELRNDSSTFILIQNTNLLKDIGVSIKLDTLTNVILKDGSIIPSHLIKEEFKLLPGDMAIFMR